MNLRTALSAAVLAVGSVTLSFAGLASADVTGKATFEGKAPERKKINMAAVAQCAQQHTQPVLEEVVVVDKDKGLRDVVISITNPPAGGKPSDQPVVLDQKGCQYVPHVLATMIGQRLLVKNSDPFLHNVHGLPEENPGFNFGQNNIDPGKPAPPMKVVENFRIKCDVHPWMNAHMYVFDHPYFAVTKADGSFSIAGLKDGEYDVLAQHAKLGEQEGKVTVKDGKGEVSFTFTPEEAADAGPAAPAVATKTVSLATEPCKACCEKDKAKTVAQVSAPAKTN